MRLGKLIRQGSPLASARRSRAGFTLVEVLLALALMMAVLAIAFAGMVLFQNVTVAGREQAAEAQLVRAIERKIRADIRSVLYREPEPAAEEEDEGSSAGYATMNEGVGAADDPGGTTAPPSPEAPPAAGASGTSNSSATTVAETTVAEPTTAFSSQSMGVYGDSTMLVLHVSKPTRASARAVGTLADAATTGPVSELSDLRSISYFLAFSGAGGLEGAVGNTATGGTAMFTTEQGSQGLARLDGDRLRIEQAEANNNLALLAQQAKIMAPEVVALQFRYFDGLLWLNEWDTSTMGALPRAIEITMQIETASATENSTDGTAEDESSTSTLSTSGLLQNLATAPGVHRFVVTLPMSDPALGMTTMGGMP